METNDYIYAKYIRWTHFCNRRAHFQIDLKMLVTSSSTFENVSHIVFVWGSNAYSACFDGARFFACWSLMSPQ
jgi:hypothetical protein